ncbi:MAG: HlyD family secretion protein [Acidobacteriaceae bacterium]
MAEQTTEQPREDIADELPEEPRSRPRRRFIIIGVVALLVVGALLWWWHSTYYEDTDDAQVDGNIVQVSARIAGNVQTVYVNQNQFVQAGALLVQLDPSDYETALSQAEANLESAEANYEAARVNVPIFTTNTGTILRNAGVDVSSAQEGVTESQNMLKADEAKVTAAQAEWQKAQLDVQRYTPLVQKDIISKQQYDAVVATATADRAAVEEAQADVVAAQDAVRMARDRVTQAQSSLQYARTGPRQVAVYKAKADQAAAQVDQARAALSEAKLNLEYCQIHAPTSGIVTTKNVQPGQNVSTGQALMTLVSLDNIWITANFKETQLQSMRPKQPVTIHVDAYDRDYDGYVAQIGGATGSMLSLFPPENATGNYVKVVQRVPVRINLTQQDMDRQNKDHLLRPGMSVEPKVRVKN